MSCAEEKNNRSQARNDYSGQSLAGLDFSNFELENADFSGSSLTGVDFTNAELEESNFQGTSLTGCDFTNSDLSEADFRKSTLTRCDFTNCDLDGANFDGTSLTGCDFTNAEIDEAIGLDNLIGEEDYNNQNSISQSIDMVSGNDYNINITGGINASGSTGANIFSASGN